MFATIRTIRFLKVLVTSNDLEISFVGRIAHIARVHQFNKKEHIKKSGLLYNVSTTAFSATDSIGMYSDTWVSTRAYFSIS